MQSKILLSLLCLFCALSCKAQVDQAQPVQFTAVSASLPELKNNFNIQLGVYVYNASIEKYKEHPEKLADAIASFGFNTVYLGVSSRRLNVDEPYTSYIRNLTAALYTKSIKLHCTMFETNIFGEEMDNGVRAYWTYQKGSTVKQRFQGISFDIEAHTMTERNADWKHVAEKYNINTYWKGENGYGADGPNSKIMKIVLTQIKEIKDAIKDKNAVYSEAIGHFYEDHFVTGDFSVGGINDYTKDCDYAIIMNYTDDAKRLIRQSEMELKNAIKPLSVEIAIKTVDNGVGELTTSYADEGWDAMMDGLNKLCLASKPYPSFRGIGIFDFSGLEKMWDEKKTKTKTNP